MLEPLSIPIEGMDRGSILALISMSLGISPEAFCLMQPLAVTSPYEKCRVGVLKRKEF